MPKGERIAERAPRPPADPERRIAFRFGLSAESRAAAIPFHCRPWVSTEVRCRSKKTPLQGHHFDSYKTRSFLLIRRDPW
jgi:hypothetical protein